MTKAPDVSLSHYENRSRSIIQLVDRLRDEGAQLEIDLPTVVFCGNQSAGKSSLLEAISGIKLPRSDGTCTRCPMEIRLSDTPTEWECSISLQIKYGMFGNPLKTIEDVPFIQKIKDRNQVELQVRRAQKALLNPSFRSAEFRDYEFDDSQLETRNQEIENNQLKFTMNTVCVKISGSSVNLTLIDLPGIIRSTETKEDAGLITTVEDIVKKHIQNPRSLIIATISCKDEIENQAIIALAKEADPNGRRTIGVLTKPDTIEPNCHDTWLQVLENKRFRLQLGYFAVKNPSKRDLDADISHEEARKTEIDFFTNTQPWSNCGMELKSKMGVSNLRKALSLQLTKLIEASLPSMRSKVKELLAKYSESLSALPEPIQQEPKIEILNRIRELGFISNELIEARGSHKSFYRLVNNHFTGFIKEIKSCRPVLILPEDSDSDCDCDSNNDEDDDEVAAFKNHLEEYISYQGNNLPSEFTPQVLKEIIESHKGRELSTNYNFESLQYVVKECQNQWKENSIACLENIENELKTVIINEVDKIFGRFENLNKKTKDLVETLIQNCSKATQDTLDAIYLMELDYPVTKDNDRLKMIYDHIHSLLESPLNHKELEQFKNAHKNDISTCLHYLSEIGLSSTVEDLPKLKQNLFDSSIRDLIETSQAYYKLASSRYGDNVSMTIHSSLLKKFSKSVESHLIESLKLLKEDDGLAVSLIKEDPDIVAQRDDLTLRLKRLREVRKTLA